MKGARSFGPMYGEVIKRQQALVRSSRTDSESEEEGLIITTYQVNGPIKMVTKPGNGVKEAVRVAMERHPRIALELMNPPSKLRGYGSIVSGHLNVEDATWLRDVLDEYIATQVDPTWRPVGSASDNQGREWINLAHPNFDGPDGFRLVVWPGDPESEEDFTGPLVERVYPCRLCGWNESCDEGCHS